MNNLPPVDELIALAKTDPKRLEQIQREAIQTIIDKAGPEQQRKLRGLQFKIDVEIQKHSTQLARCIAISNMMHQSLNQLHSALFDGVDSRPSTSKTKNVIPFKPKP